MKYKFQIENGYISTGNDEIKIVDFIGDAGSPITVSKQMLIDAHGGILLAEKKRKPATKRRVTDGSSNT